MNKLQRAKQLLDKNEEQQEVHFTSDGFPFFKKAQAESHASRLADKGIETITRDQVATEAEPDENNVEDKGETVKPLSKMNKTELLAEAAKRNLTVAEKISNKDLAAAIEEADRVAALEPTPVDKTEGEE